MPDQMTIYQKYADQYDALVAYEDYQHDLYPALAAIRSFDQADVVEWGAGTGRVSALVAPYARSIIAGDLNPHMLHVAAAKYRQFEQLKWQTVVMDHRHAPLSDRVADVALAGWTLCYLASKFCGDTWQHHLTQAIAEMRRVLRPGGMIIIIETLGTGETEPKPQSEWFAEYFAFLENELQFSATSIRTDYKFDSLDQAASTIRFFFGEEWDEKVRRNNWIIVPECTGLWWKVVE
jgi:ubiquinone/menaquinone biosynthesis C-methylase UbiE